MTGGGAGGRAVVAGAGVDRYELLRALGACTAITPPASRTIIDALGIDRWDPAEHTRLFVMELPPHESIHLGAEGALGGEAAERAAGIWRALGLDPPTDADHLAALLALYAHLGEAAARCRTDPARRRLEHARTVVLHEHLWAWVPGYLTAARRSGAGEWCDLLGDALSREVDSSPLPATLPASLREAPPAIEASISLEDLLDALVAPVRVGFVLTWRDLAQAAGQVGVGLRRGERRFALRAMLEQDAAGTIGWLAGHACRWAEAHRPHGLGDADPAPWWRARAEATASVLADLEADAAASRT